MQSELTDNLSMSFFSTRSKYNCLISLSNRLGRPGYMVEPPDSTICLYSSVRMSISAACIVLNTISAMPGTDAGHTNAIQAQVGTGHPCSVTEKIDKY